MVDYVACWFKLNGMPVPMFVQSAFERFYSGCIYTRVREILPCVYNSVTEGVCMYVQHGLFFWSFYE